MLIKNITNDRSPKPIGIGDYVIMPGESVDVPDEIAYVDEIDKSKRRTGKKVILPAIILLSGMNQITYEETKKTAKEKTVEEPAEEAVEETVVEEKPKRGRKKAG